MYSVSDASCADIISTIKSDYGFDVVTVQCMSPRDSEDAIIPSHIREYLDVAKSIGLKVDFVSWGFSTVFDTCVGDSDSSIYISSLDSGVMCILRRFDVSDTDKLNLIAQQLGSESLDVDTDGNIDMSYADLTYEYCLEGNIHDGVVLYYVGDDFDEALQFLSSF